VEIELDNEAAKSWVEDQLGSLAMHRGAGSEGEGGGEASERSKPVIWFAPEADDHPLGPLLIFEGGAFASSYRVRDRQITQVNRQLGKLNMTITVLENKANEHGKFLPSGYTVHYWDAGNGTLDSSETVQDRWQKMGEFDLPVEHSVTLSSALGLTVRQFVLSDLVLSDKK
jgi:hypothetical protein